MYTQPCCDRTVSCGDYVHVMWSPFGWLGGFCPSNTSYTDIGRLITELKSCMHPSNVPSWAFASALSVIRQIGLWCLDGQSPSNSS